MFPLAMVGWLAFSVYAWVRLDRLCDAAALAPSGGPRHRSLVRQIVAMIGWWLFFTATAFGAARFDPTGVLGLMATGLALVLVAVEMKRRGDMRASAGAL